jgi:hypothetical protein
MDKTVEIIVVAMIALVVAMILIFMVRGQSDSFLNFANSQTSDAECDIIDASGEDVPPECVDIEGGNEDTSDEPEVGPECNTRPKENCGVTGACHWSSNANKCVQG